MRISLSLYTLFISVELVQLGGTFICALSQGTVMSCAPSILFCEPDVNLIKNTGHLSTSPKPATIAKDLYLCACYPN